MDWQFTPNYILHMMRVSYLTQLTKTYIIIWVRVSKHRASIMICQPQWVCYMLRLYYVIQKWMNKPHILLVNEQVYQSIPCNSQGNHCFNMVSLKKSRCYFRIILVRKGIFMTYKQIITLGSFGNPVNNIRVATIFDKVWFDYIHDWLNQWHLIEHSLSSAQCCHLLDIYILPVGGWRSHLLAQMNIYIAAF